MKALSIPPLMDDCFPRHVVHAYSFKGFEQTPGKLNCQCFRYNYNLIIIVNFIQCTNWSPKLLLRVCVGYGAIEHNLTF